MIKNSLIKNLYKGFKDKLSASFQNPYKEVNISWARLKYYKHLSAGKLRTHILFGRPLFFYNPEELLHAFDEIFLQGVYKQELQNNPYILDCGANIGLSVIYLKHFYPGAEIVAFEPDKTNFDVLEKNIKSFGYSKVSLRNEAVWKENTIIKFSNEGLMSSKISTRDGETGTIEVTAVRLRDLIDKKIDFLKIDIEGAEFVVITDIRDKLHFVQNMFIEYHGTFRQNNELVELMTLITECGFNFYIKEATSVYQTPFYRRKNTNMEYDVQLNIFCFRIFKYNNTA